MYMIYKYAIRMTPNNYSYLMNFSSVR